MHPSNSPAPPIQTRLSVLLLVALAILLTGCREQQEGERCNLGSGDENCREGLRCVSLAERNQASFGAICCPDSDPEVDRCRTRPVPLQEDLDAGEPSVVIPLEMITQPRSVIVEASTTASDAGTDSGSDAAD